MWRFFYSVISDNSFVLHTHKGLFLQIKIHLCVKIYLHLTNVNAHPPLHFTAVIISPVEAANGKCEPEESCLYFSAAIIQ